MQVKTGITATSSQDLEIDSENIKPTDKKMETRKKNDKITKSKGCQKKIEASYASLGHKAARSTHPTVAVSTYDSLRSGTRTEVVILPDDEDVSACREYNSEKRSRYISRSSYECVILNYFVAVL